LRETKSRISGCAVSSKKVGFVLLGYNKLRRVKKISKERKKKKTQKKRERERERERAPTNIGAAQLTVPVAYVSIYPFGFVWLVLPSYLQLQCYLLNNA